jgi:hypothetical protein
MSQIARQRVSFYREMESRWEEARWHRENPISQQPLNYLQASVQERTLYYREKEQVSIQ